MSAAESLPAPQTSQIVVSAESVNEEHRLAKAGAENAVQHAIRCGQLLQQVKAGLAHGEFQAWIEGNCEFQYSTAARYLKAADQKSTGVEVSSLSHLFPSGRPKAERAAAVIQAPPEEKAAPRNLPRAERVSQIRELSNEGHTPAQIAQKIGVSADRITAIAKQENITLANHSIGKVHKLNVERVLTEAVHSISGGAQGISAIRSAKITLDAATAADLANELRSALTSYNWLLKTLRGIANG